MKHFLRSFPLSIISVLFGISGSLAQGTEPVPITVGLVLSLTGRSAEFGNAARNGIELAREEAPELFANIRFIYEDSFYDGKTSIAAFNKLTTIDQADLVLVWGHGPVQAVAPVAEAAHRPAVMITGQKEIAAGKKYIVRFCSPHPLYAKALLKHIRSLGYRKIALVKTELGFINDTVEALAAGLAPPETLQVIDTFDPGESDFGASVTKLKTKNFQLLGLFLGEDQSAQYLARMSSLGIMRPLFGTHTIGGKVAIEAIQKYSGGAFFAANNVDPEFNARYLAKYGTDIQITWAANAYDFAVLTGELFGKLSGKPSALEIVESYKNVKNKTGVAGSFGYSDDAEHGSGFVFPVMIKTINKTGITVSEPGK